MDDVRLLLPDGRMTWTGGEVFFTPCEAAMLSKLASRKGYFVPATELANRIWPAEWPKGYSTVGTSLARLKHDINAKLAGTGLDITSRRIWGYRLNGDFDTCS